MPVVVACLVPAAPLLLPVLTGAQVPEAEPVRAAVAQALSSLGGLDRVVVVAQEAPGTLAGFGAPAAVDGAGRRPPGYEQGAVPGGSWPHELALALLEQVADAPPVRRRRSWTEPSLLEPGGPEPGTGDGARTGLLLLADGSRTRGPRTPGGDDPRGADVDTELAAALRAGRAAVAPDAGAVGATARAAVDLMARLPGRTELLHEAAPLGVCYLVAVRTCSP